MKAAQFMGTLKCSHMAREMNNEMEAERKLAELKKSQLDLLLLQTAKSYQAIENQATLEKEKLNTLAWICEAESGMSLL
jgi:hypothetical protein